MNAPRKQHSQAALVGVNLRTVQATAVACAVTSRPEPAALALLPGTSRR